MRFRSRALLALAIAAVAVAAVGPAQAKPGRSMVTINVGWNPSLPQAAFPVAMAKGYFAKYGIDVSLSIVTAPAPALINNSIQMAMTTTSTAYTNAAAGRSTPIIMTLGQHLPVELFVSKKIDNPNLHKPYPANVKALPKGVTIGITAPGSVTDYWTRSILDGAGLKVGSDYSFVYLGTGANITAALASGQVDVALLFPEFDALALKQGYGTIMIKSPEGPKTLPPLYGVMVLVNKQWAEGNLQAVKNTVKALTEAQRFIQNPKNQQEVMEIQAKAENLQDPSVLAPDMPLLREISHPQVSCQRIGGEMKWLSSVGLVTIRPACEDIVMRSVAPTTDPFAKPVAKPKPKPKKKK